MLLDLLNMKEKLEPLSCDVQSNSYFTVEVMAARTA
jgi:hypothetical protein